MSNLQKVKLNTGNVRKLLKSQEVFDYVKYVAQEKCGTDGHVKSFVGFDRATSIIYPNTKKYGGDE